MNRLARGAIGDRMNAEAELGKVGLAHLVPTLYVQASKGDPRAAAEIR
jgi:hypothetical protein